jgi:hypothetical protein
MVVRSVQNRPEILTAEFKLALFGSLPMANLLLAGIASMGRGKPSTPFLLGFEAFGWLAVFAFFGCALARPASVETCLTPVLLLVPERSFDSAHPLILQTVRIGLAAGLLLAAELMIALAGGWLIQRIGRPRSSASRPDYPQRRGRLGALLGAVGVAVALAVAFEGALRHVVDRATARFGAGANVVLDLKIMPRYDVILLSGSTSVLANGTQLRIVDDSDASQVAVVQSPHGEYVGDLRMVLVSLGSGPRVGELTHVPRCFLRIVR